MARDFNVTFTTFAPLSYGADQPVAEAAESTVGKNINWLHANKVIPLVTHLFGNDVSMADDSMYVAPQEDNGDGYQTVGSWMRDLQADFDQLRVVVIVKNTNTAATGRVRFRALDAGEEVIFTIGTTTTGFVTHSGVLDVDPALGSDTICIDVLNPALFSAGFVAVQSVCIYAMPLTSPLDAGVTSDGFVPMESNDLHENEPLTTYQRKVAFDNLHLLTDKRVGGTLLSYTENGDERNNSNWRIRTQSAVYDRIIEIPVRVPHGINAITWAVQGWVSSGSAGQVKITCINDPTGIECDAFSGTWTYGDPNASKWGKVDDQLLVQENTNELITIEIKSDGAKYAYLAGLMLWFAEYVPGGFSP
jgi:hypothetical protein